MHSPSISPQGIMNVLASPAGSRYSDGSHGTPLPFGRSPSMSDFEVERAPRQSPANPKRQLNRRSNVEYDNEQVLRTSVSQLLAATTRPFTVSGRIPLDPAVLVLFFRSKVSPSPPIFQTRLSPSRAASHIVSISLLTSTTIHRRHWTFLSLPVIPTQLITTITQIANHYTIRQPFHSLRLWNLPTILSLKLFATLYFHPFLLDIT